MRRYLEIDMPLGRGVWVRMMGGNSAEPNQTLVFTVQEGHEDRLRKVLQKAVEGLT
ncbi:MAG: hypothetical protein OXG44_07365 [Gammaproteobacteria bacterium]|nr:hypothetical protein [Gammaproteobacteria bacterium]